MTLEFAFSVRKLCSDDIEVYADLLRTHRTTWTKTLETVDFLQKSRNLLESKDLYVFGIFDSSNRIVMSISSRVWSHQPTYSIAAFKSRSTLPLRDFKLMFRSLIEYLLREMESQERFEFWYAIEDKKIYHKRKSRSGRNFLQYMTAALDEYVIFNECYVEAEQQSKWPLYAEIVGAAHPVSSVIRRAIHRRKIENN